MKIGRFTTTFIICAVLVSGALLFVVSQRVQSTERDIRFLENKITRENESIRVLQAEWAYLNRPDRLEKLATSSQVRPTAIPESLDRRIMLETVMVPVPIRKPVYNIVPNAPALIQVGTQAGKSKELPVVRPQNNSDEKDGNFNDLIQNLGNGGAR